MKRGEIYLIKRRDCIGSEIEKVRPAVIVSNNAINATNEVVEVVYLTTQPKKSLLTHVPIESTGIPSVVLCEQIDSISLKLVGKQIGTCHEEELKAIDRALMHSLGLLTEAKATTMSDKEKELEPMMQELSKGEAWLIEELGKMQAERDRYAKMIDVLLGGHI
jgi:mRNA interferase MazF